MVENSVLNPFNYFNPNYWQLTIIHLIISMESINGDYFPICIFIFLF
jgi:hypothetical protein